jgi:hypothetical protein
MPQWTVIEKLGDCGRNFKLKTVTLQNRSKKLVPTQVVYFVWPEMFWINKSKRQCPLQMELKSGRRSSGNFIVLAADNWHCGSFHNSIFRFVTQFIGYATVPKTSHKSVLKSAIKTRTSKSLFCTFGL